MQVTTMPVKTIPIKKILLEFDFVRNNPAASTLGAAAIGGAVMHDFHKGNHKGVGGYLDSKIDQAKGFGSNIKKAFSDDPKHVDHSSGSSNSFSPSFPKPSPAVGSTDFD